MERKRIPRVSNCLKKIDHTVTTVFDSFAFIAAICLTTVMLMAVLDVLGSKIFNKSLAMAFEVTEMLSIPIVFLAVGSIVFGRGPMIVDIVFNRLNKKAQTIIMFIGNIVGVGIAIIIAERSWIYMNDLMDLYSRTSGAVKIFKWPFALILSFGWASVALGCFFRMLRPILGYDSKPDLSPDEIIAWDRMKKESRGTEKSG